MNFQHDKVVPDHRICYKSWSYVLFEDPLVFLNLRWRRQDGALNIGKKFKNANFAKISYFLYENTMPDHCNEHK